MKTITQYTPMIYGRVAALQERRKARAGRLQRVLDVTTERVLLPLVALLCVALIGAITWSVIVGVITLF